MTVAVTTLRATIASALSNPSVWQVFDHVPASPLANSLVIAPDDPYITPSNNDYKTISPMAHFILKLYVPLLDNKASLNNIETFMVAAFNKLAESALKYKIGSVSGVSVDTTAGDLLTADLRISILTSWE